MGGEGANRPLEGEHPTGPGLCAVPLRPGLTCALLFGPVQPGLAGLGSVLAPPARAAGPELPRPLVSPAAGTALKDGEGLGALQGPHSPTLGGLLHPTHASPLPQNRCHLLPSLCRSSCWVLARISATRRSWASSSSCGGCRGPCSGSGC